ncbi:MAG TPA: TlpA disulfide reductase family protein [Longimicrobiaceae bacterium]|nr:TlpA disulfide reductase family protein [Longimicrobiaceae bacterium]
MRNRVWIAGCAGLVAAGACADQRVTLRAEGAELAYDCAHPAARAADDAGRAVIRAYAINVVRDARNHGRLKAVDSLSQAFGAGDERTVERHVVRYVCTYGDPSSAAKRLYPESGSTPPEIVLARYTPHGAGTPFRLSEHRGRIVVLDFWGTYCKPCIQELPHLAAFSRQIGDPRLAVYTVLYHDRPAAAAQWLAEHHIDLPLLVDEGGAVKDATGTLGVPYTMVIGPDGKVAFANAYPGEELATYVRNTLADLGPAPSQPAAAAARKQRGEDEGDAGKRSPSVGRQR